MFSFLDSCFLSFVSTIPSNCHSLQEFDLRHWWQCQLGRSATAFSSADDTNDEASVFDFHPMKELMRIPRITAKKNIDSTELLRVNRKKELLSLSVNVAFGSRICGCVLIVAIDVGRLVVKIGVDRFLFIINSDSLNEYQGVHCLSIVTVLPWPFSTGPELCATVHFHSLVASCVVWR